MAVDPSPRSADNGVIPQNASLRSYDSKVVSDDTGTMNDGVTLVQQQFAEEVDINTIVRRFGLTAAMPSGPAGGMYGDFTGIQDYQDALEAIERAHAGFMTLAPEVRERFHNDPGELIAFAQSVSETDFEAAFAPPVPAPAGGGVVPPDGGTS